MEALPLLARPLATAARVDCAGLEFPSPAWGTACSALLLEGPGGGSAAGSAPGLGSRSALGCKRKNRDAGAQPARRTSEGGAKRRGRPPGSGKGARSRGPLWGTPGGTAGVAEGSFTARKRQRLADATGGVAGSDGPDGAHAGGCGTAAAAEGVAEQKVGPSGDVTRPHCDEARAP